LSDNPSFNSPEELCSDGDDGGTGSAETKISDVRIINITAIGEQRRLMAPSKGVSVIIAQKISCCAGRDNRPNPAIVGWEIPEKEGRKPCSGRFDYGSMRPLRMAYPSRESSKTDGPVKILSYYAPSLGGVPG